MATISSIGVGSNLPLNELLTSLRENENNALVLIQNRQVAMQTRISAYGKLRDSVSALQTAAQAVGKAEAFGALKASSSSEALSATAGKTAIAGQYAIQVDALASAQTLVAQGRADRSAAIGTGGSVTITLANGTAHTVDLAGKDTSLNGLVAALNADPDAGVNATLVNDGSGQPHRLLLTSRSTGTEAAVAAISVSGNDDLAAFLDYDKAGGSTANFGEQAATNAQLSINGIPISSQTNTVKDAIDGVELTLKQTTTAPASLSITRDDSAASKAINDFVKAYNGLLGTIKSLTSYDTSTQKASALTGDSLARRVQSEIRNAISGAIGQEGITLSRIGITTDPKTGELKVDDDTLSKALSSNLSGVTSLFSGTSGVGSRVDGAANAFTRSGGLFSTTTESLDRSLDQMQKQFDATADRIDQRMETYRQQFTRLDSMVAQMNSLSTYLTQQLSMLNNLAKGEK